MQSVKANVLRTTRDMASAFRMTCATASNFRTRSIRALFLSDVECQGKSYPDDTSHGICLLDEKCQGICDPDTARVLQTQSVQTNIVRMTQATASTCRMKYTTGSTFRTRSVRAFYLLDAKCQGKCPPDNAFHSICLPDNTLHGICLPDDMCHGIYLPDEECQRIIRSGH